jgi:hypothetical protein
VVVLVMGVAVGVMGVVVVARGHLLALLLCGSNGWTLGLVVFGSSRFLAFH